MFSKLALFNPYVLGILATGLVASHLYMYQSGVGSEREEQEVKQAEMQRVFNAALTRQIVRSNEIAAALEADKEKVRIVTKEVIKYVDKVTVKRECLLADAVRVLNNSTTHAPVVPGGPPEPEAEETAGPSASDRDVFLWIANAREEYRSCAADYNALIEIRQQQRSEK